MNALFGFMIQRRMMFSAKVALVGLAWSQEKPEFVLGCSAAEPSELHIRGLELSFFNGVSGYS